MNIEVWSDIACPFCYIGKRKFEEALAAFDHKNDVTYEFKAYQLDPDAKPYAGEDYYEQMAQKFGSVDRAKQMTANISEQAQSVGLEYHFDTIKPTNTYDAHRLTEFAKTHGKGTAVAEKLFEAYFTESKDVADHETLIALAVEAGLDKEATRSMLNDPNAYRNEVNNDIEEAGQLGITSVPSFIINRKYAVSGAQPTEAFTEALEKVWEEENKASPLQDLSADSDEACGPEGCAVPEENESQ